jgi:hypothetical protein
MMPQQNTKMEMDGCNILDDIRNGWHRTFNKKLGNKIKKTLTGNTAKKNYKKVADDGIDAVAIAPGRPVVGSIAKKLGDKEISGIGMNKKVSKEKDYFKT